MSRKLGVLVLAMGILVGAMGLKSALTTHAKGAVLTASGVSPVPPPPKNGPKN
jgi:hypothetical protein